jgi:hypothetical protein
MAPPTQKLSGQSELPEAEAVFAALARLLAPYLARAIRDELRAASGPDWINQHCSALGPRRHCSAVRKRISERSGGAEICGRDHLLSRAAHDEELHRAKKRKRPDEDSLALAAELGLKLVARSAK